MKIPDISARPFLVALVATAWILVGLGHNAEARGYQGAQAEAQLDGQLDPYSFPNITLCCDRKPGSGRPQNRPDWLPPQPPYNPVVNCAVPTTRGVSFG